jgi:hypothetical protein
VVLTDEGRVVAAGPGLGAGEGGEGERPPAAAAPPLVVPPPTPLPLLQPSVASSLAGRRVVAAARVWWLPLHLLVQETLGVGVVEPNYPSLLETVGFH